MNKLSFEILENEFKKLYEEGSIWKNGNKISVSFKKNGKVYDYRGNHLTVAQKLNLNTSIWMYEFDYNNCKRQLEENEKLLKNGYYEPLFEDDKPEIFTDEDIIRIQKEITYFKNKIKNVDTLI